MKKISFKINTIIASILAAFLPALAFAQNNLPLPGGTQPGGVAGQNVTGLVNIFGNLVNLSIGILITLALAVFFWGLVRYIFKLGGDEGAKNGKNLMIYGIIALFIMVSIWGIVSFVGSFLGVSQNQGQDVGNLVPRR
jgi:hypothetical protein